MSNDLSTQAKSAAALALVALAVVSIFGTPLMLGVAAIIWALN